MLKEYTCIICPNGCTIAANLEGSNIISLTGGECKRGQDYVRQEIINPIRTVSSSVLLEGGVLPLASVRLTKPVPKANIFAVMAEIKKIRLTAPVAIGQIAAKNILGLGSDVIVTKNVPAKS